MTVRIEPMDRAEAERRGLGENLSLNDEVGVPGEVFLRILAHVPGYAEAIFDAMYTSHVKGKVDHSLKEVVRLQLAETASDPYFSSLRSEKAEGLSEERIAAGHGDFEHDPGFSEAERWALRYAYLLYRSPEDVDASFYDEGKRFYTEAQIMELGGMIALHYGMQRFMAALDDGR